MVACHSELRMFFFDNEVIQIFLLWKFITESQTIIEQAEANNDGTVVHWLKQNDCQFVILIADFLFFSPDWLPGFVKGSRLRIFQLEAIIKIGFRIELGEVSAVYPVKVGSGIIFFFQFQSESARLNYHLAFVSQVVGWCAFFVNLKGQNQIAIR